MTTSQQPRPGRHARPDESGGALPPGPSSLPPVPRQRGVGEQHVTMSIDETGPIGPGFGEWPFGPRKRDEAVPADEPGLLRAESGPVRDDAGPAVTEFAPARGRQQPVPDGPGQARRGSEPDDDDEFAGQNPYLPCEDAAPEVRLAPGGLPGTLALLAGVAGVVLALIPFIAIAVWPLTILGLVLGVVGLRRVRAGSARNSVVAATGIVLSAAALALCAVWLSMFAVAGVGAAQDVIDRSPIPVLVR